MAVGVDGREGGHVHGQRQAHFRVSQHRWRVEFGCQDARGDPVPVEELIAGGLEHFLAGGAGGVERRQPLSGDGDPCFADRGQQSAERGVGTSYEQNPGGSRAVQQPVLHQQGQVTQRPAVRVVDDQQDSQATVRAQVLAARRWMYLPGAV